MAKEAIKSHAPALYLLAVIQFNSSIGSKKTRISEQEWRYERKPPFLATQRAPRVRRPLSKGRVRACVKMSPRGGASWSKPAPVGVGCPLLSDFGCNVPVLHEFHRCSGCGAVNYCSQACQALNWKMRHKVECALMESGLKTWFSD
ncbi:hypothetical protein U1Q18_035818 [Sarracenia purpurea var. burkii]